MKQLKDILKKFSYNRTEYLNSHSWATMPEDERVNAVKEWAEPIAKKIINEGFFSIGNHYCIRVDILELYYNEEEGGETKQMYSSLAVQTQIIKYWSPLLRDGRFSYADRWTMASQGLEY